MSDQNSPIPGRLPDQRTVKKNQLSKQFHAADRQPPPDSNLVPFLTRVAMILAVLMALRFVAPEIVEEIQYAATRGEQRAKFEVAGDALKSAPLDQLSLAYQMVSHRVAPSVVHIEATSSESDRIIEDEMVHLFPRGKRSEQNQGSGVIVSEDGFIVTNLHVIAGTSQIVVTHSDGRQFVAETVGTDRLTDLAVLKIEASGLSPAVWDNSDDLDEGALVWAIGSPFGFQHSITAGIVSAKNRSNRAGTAYQDFLQTDAAVNPGNSGGPLVNAQGKIVGINTMIVGPSFQGISLAIPSNVARRVYEGLRTDGQVARGWLGISLATVTNADARRHNLDSTDGAMVQQLVSTEGHLSPAAKAGIVAEDIIVEWDGGRIDSTQQLSRSIAETPIGTTVNVIVLREGESVDLQVQVGGRPAQWN